MKHKEIFNQMLDIRILPDRGLGQAPSERKIALDGSKNAREAP